GGNATAGGPSSTSTSPVWATIASPNFESGYSAIGQQDQNILTSVACASSSECWAVGYSQPTDGFGDRSGAVSTLTEEWNGSSWVIVSSPNWVNPDNTQDWSYLNGVACNSASDCWAVGHHFGTGTHTLIEH